MYGALSTEQYLDATAAGAGAMTDALANHPLDTPVPSCPGWDLGDLGGHLGVVHRWALDSLTSSSPPDEGPPGPREELASWYADSADALLAALRGTDPDTACWGFGPRPRTVRFWLRRQAHETSMHSWDALVAIGREPRIDADVAADGVDEVVSVFYPRQVRLGRRPPLGVALAFSPTDAGGPAVLGEGEAVASLSGPAELLLLGLWRRRDWGRLLDDGLVRLDGDAPAARAVLAQAHTP
ncbi:maleylpyruvate isomerase family mycothiol-dependent enzyme [Angustibacter sp. McL0619]|uniref:maleylpyruvate isomerase family mycothiol-dependent enzyme n=1 Tax=Angustibacter sp. McL0619 TaxID=3415676 RepID=UPI003CE9D963